MDSKRVKFESRLAISKPDIIGILEVNPKNATLELPLEDLQRSGYNAYFYPKGLRVVLYIKDSLSSSET